jgi:hypothetical protein
LFGLVKLFFRCFLRFFAKGVIQDQQPVTVKEAKQPKNIAGMPDPDFPDSVSTCQFLEKFPRDNINSFNKIKNKDDFFSLLDRQGLDILSYRLSPIFQRIKNYCFYNSILALTRTLSRTKLSP